MFKINGISFVKTIMKYSSIKGGIMRHLTFVLMLIGAVLIFFGCQQEGPVAPMENQNNDAAISELNLNEEDIVLQLKESDETPVALERWTCTSFTGIDNFVQDIDPGTVTVLPNGKTLTKGQIAEWYESASDPRVTGQSIWHINSLADPDGTMKFWGKTEINVEDNGGQWKTVWFGGTVDGGLKATAVGIGKKGAVKGMFAKWNYSMVFANGFFYTFEGKIFSRR